jgi:hypothetical protein
MATHMTAVSLGFRQLVRYVRPLINHDLLNQNLDLERIYQLDMVGLGYTPAPDLHQDMGNPQSYLLLDYLLLTAPVEFPAG